MEDSEPICETEQASFCVEILKRLNMQRGQGYLCDITLVAKEGNEFKAHRNVLSAATPFFAKLLQSEMREKEEGVIRFEDISASILEEVLEFIYTGSIKIDDERKAKDLIIAADYLLLLCLKTIARQFLDERLTIFNCVSTYYFADKYQCEELVAKSKTLILENFASVAETDEFLNLEAEEVGSWISRDEICVEEEEDVLKTIQKWIEQRESDRKANFEELFCHVRLVFVSRDSLLDVVTHRMVRQNHTCLEKVLHAIAVVSDGSEDALMQSPRRRFGIDAIVAFGGINTMCYLPQRDEWKVLADSLKDQNLYVHTVIFRDQLFTFTESCTERYDPFFNNWSSAQEMRLPSQSTVVAVESVSIVRGHIYSLYHDRETGMSIIKRYNTGSSSWESIFTFHGCRIDCCVVAVDNCLYVLGGTTSNQWDDYPDYRTEAERFDTVQNKWEVIANMQESRGNAFGVATQGKIFVAGGIDSVNVGGKLLQTCEVYSISTNEWQFIGGLNVPRYWGSMVCVNGILYVLGGLSGPDWSPDYTVESYDPAANEWTRKTSIPVDKIPRSGSALKGCALKVSKAVCDKPCSP